MPQREFYTEYGYDTPIKDVKYIGPYLANRLRNSVYFGAARPIQTLGDLRSFVMTRTGASAKERIKLWLEDTLQNEHVEECVGQIRKAYQRYDNQDHLYSVRSTNRNAFDALVAWLRANVPQAHKYKVPAAKRNRSAHNAFPEGCAL